MINVSGTHHTGIQAMIGVYLCVGIGTFVAAREPAVVSIIEKSVELKIRGVGTRYGRRIGLAVAASNRDSF
jgi:hypothetical protein